MTVYLLGRREKNNRPGAVRWTGTALQRMTAAKVWETVPADSAEVAAEATDTSCYLVVVSGPTGAQTLKTIASATANAVTGAVSVTSLAATSVGATSLSATSLLTGTVFLVEEHDAGNSGAAKAIDWNNGLKQKLTLTDNCTVSFTPPATGGAATLRLKVVQGGAGNFAITWPGTTFAAGGVAPTLTVAAGSVDMLVIDWDGTNYHVGMAIADSKLIP